MTPRSPRDIKVTIRYSQSNTPEAKIPRNSFRQLAMRKILTALWWIAQAPTRRFLENRLFVPRTYPTPASQNLILESGQRFQVQVNDKTVQCWKLGHGPAILFVHGWNGRGIQFHHFFDRLTLAGYSAVIFDAPAHGESQGPTTNGFEFAETVRALLNPDNELDIRGIIAHSLGAATVIMALARQEHCPDAVLIAPPLQLRKILFDSFENAGIPDVIYKTMISELESNLGYAF
jgi:pimeloyl-ACP methyl ester carboxylesterase